MLTIVDNFLNRITMYRVVLYGLIILGITSILFSFFGHISYTPLQLSLSLLIVTSISYVSNIIFSKIVRAPTNIESAWITGLILFFIFLPASTINESIVLAGASVLAMASKYLLAFNRKHIFNPVAISAVILGLLGRGEAIWWVATPSLLPIVSVLGFFIVRKIRRFGLVISFLIVAVLMILVSSPTTNSVTLLREIFTSWPLIFFATIMLTEPLTTPPTWRLQILYGAIVGALFSTQYHIGLLFSSPEAALVGGNIFSYIISPKYKLMLYLKEKIDLGGGNYEFSFKLPKQIIYSPGQYMEWTLPPHGSDSRGNRRYFTLSSSPTEDSLKLGIHFNQQGSSFKRELLNLEQDEAIMAAQLAGDFTLPADPSTKAVFIAGGIGITPFRSMMKYLLDKKEKRDYVLLYSVKNAAELAYKDIFDQAQRELGIKTIYTITDDQAVPKDWKGRVGRINEAVLKEEVPDYLARVFYISGPNMMIKAFEKSLHELGIPRKNIKKDFFPGFA